jgi:hypothetical protein
MMVRSVVGCAKSMPLVPFLAEVKRDETVSKLMRLTVPAGVAELASMMFQRTS